MSLGIFCLFSHCHVFANHLPVYTDRMMSSMTVVGLCPSVCPSVQIGVPRAWLCLFSACLCLAKPLSVDVYDVTSLLTVGPCSIPELVLICPAGG